MIGAIVNHPLFGRGQVLELRNAARSAVVRFDNGLRAVVQSNMLSTLQPAESAASANRGVRPGQLFAPRPERVFTPETAERLEARRTIEALRYGVVPVNRIRELSVGLEDECASLRRAFAEVNESGGEVRVILGEYGAGKSHFFELAAQEALEQNFVVATTSLDLREVPPNRPQRIYHSLMRSLRYPHSTDTGLTPLLERLITQPEYSTLQDTLRGTFFASALHNYSLMREKPGEALDLLLDWMSGEKVFIKSVRDAAAIKSKEFPLPSLSQMTTAADQYCYLLNGWGWLATQAGHAGLAVFIDESEHYSLLTQRSQERADNFFKALIYTALGARGRINEADLQHQHRAHSFRLTERSHLLLLFALTPSANTFDYRRWLDEEQVLALNKYLPPAAIDELIARLYVTHRRAYAYNQSEQFLDVAQGLLECMDSNLINLRQLIRLAIEIFDLCYAHKDYHAAQAIAELRSALL
ncbi:MAG: ATP-binding protein [Acidobacteria bacterium]|nr:ATP-binding protein [Acidobacteriota bacterium]